MRIVPTGVLFLSTVFAVPAVVQATVRNVPAPYPTIQIALNASSSGDEVVVAPGTYVETIVFGPAQSGVHLRSSGGPDVTIIDGNHAGSTVTCTGVGVSGLIEGFT